MIKNNCEEVEYIHRLTEDIGGTLKKGISIRKTSSPDKRPFYTAYNGLKYILVPLEKIRVYQRTIRTATEEKLVETL